MLFDSARSERLFDDPLELSKEEQAINEVAEDFSNILEGVEDYNSVVQKKKFRSKISDEISILKETPIDIGDFITKIHENMVLYVTGKVYKLRGASVHAVINNFISSMLSEDSHGITRYLKFDNVNYPNMPYWKWFMRQLHFYCLSYNKQKIKEASEMSIEEASYDRDSSRESLSTSMDVLSKEHFDKEVHEPIDGELIMSEVLNLLNQLKEIAPKHHSYENFAHDLLLSKLNGYKNSEFSKKIGISDAAASQWMIKLRKHVLNYCEYGYI